MLNLLVAAVFVFVVVVVGLFFVVVVVVVGLFFVVVVVVIVSAQPSAEVLQL